MKKGFSYNARKLNLQVEKIVGKAALPKARVIAERHVNKVKKEFIAEINRSPVIQEIKAGPRRVSSKFIISDKPVNLFGLLGFEAGSEPWEILYDIINEDVRLIKTVRLVNGYYRFPVIVPTIGEIEDQTPLPWTSKSWITAMERGLNGLEKFYIFVKGKNFRGSRSQKGIQIKNNLGNKKLKTNKFFTPIWRTFLSKLRGVKL